MENKQEPQLIYFKDLVFAALYRWKWIIAFALVFALLLGGTQLLGKGDTVTLTTTTLTPESEIRISRLEANKERTEQLIEEHSTYLSESVLMQLDPYASYTAGFHLSVTAEIPENVNAILRCYRFSLMDTAVLQKFEDLAEIKYFSDLLVFEQEEEAVDTLTLKVYGTSRENAAAMAEALAHAAQTLQDTFASDIGAHTIAISTFQNGPYVDFTVLEAQNHAHQRLTNLKTNLTAITTELDSLLPTALQPGSPNPLLFAVVGAVLGAFLVIAWAWVSHIASDAVYSARVLHNRTGIKILGCVRSSRKCDPVTLWLRKLEGRCNHADLDAISINIRNRCTDIRQLLILGCYSEEDLKPLADVLEKAGIVCVLQGDPAVSAATLEALPLCDAVVLVQTCKRSRYEQVIWQLQTVEDHKKPLMGCVLIDG